MATPSQARLRRCSSPIRLLRERSGPAQRAGSPVPIYGVDAERVLAGAEQERAHRDLAGVPEEPPVDEELALPVRAHPRLRDEVRPQMERDRPDVAGSDRR